MHIRIKPVLIYPICLLLLSGCAKQAPPTGGPPDRTPPSVLSASPAPGTVDVGLLPDIRIQFSERMDRASVERSLFVSPALPGDPDFDWDSNELRILFADSLRRGRTYVITIGAESADLSRNRLSDSFSFAFATGPQINRGEIIGRVVKEPGRRSRRGAQSFVWAYDIPEQIDPGSDLLARPPDYVTQPGSNGTFRFSRLGPGTYRILAFVDSNRDRTYTAGEDPLGLAPDDVELSLAGEGPLAVELGPIRVRKPDVTGPVPQTARTTDRTHLLVRFDEPVVLPDTLSITGLGVHELYHDPTDSSRLWALTETQVAGRTYRLAFDGVSDPAGNRVLSDARLEVKGEDAPDARPPEVVRTEPASGEAHVAPNAVIRFFFTEPVLPFADSLWAATDSTRSPAGTVSREAPNVLLFQPRDSWGAGAAVHLRAALSRRSDAEGNHFANDAELTFTTPHPDSLGDLKGSLRPQPVPVVIQVLARSASTLPRLRVEIAPNDTAFTLLGLTAGSYIVSGFADQNGDGKWNGGALLPYQPAEPLAIHDDTLVVRPRWEVQMSAPLDFSPWQPHTDSLRIQHRE